MTFLRTAGFGPLFAVTFTVAATFHGVMALLGVVMAFLSPGIFRMSGGVPADGPVQALGVILFLTVMMLIMNAAISAAGAGLWLAVRRLLPGRARPAP